jgi:membrane protein
VLRRAGRDEIAEQRPIPDQKPEPLPPALEPVLERAPRRLRHPLDIAVRAGIRWVEAGGPQLGASIAFYTMFALTPLLVITLAIAGAVFGPDAARGRVVGEIQSLVGTTAAAAIEGMIASAWRQHSSWLSALVGMVALLIGAGSVFAELRRALNLIGHVHESPSVVGTFVRVRLIAFALVLGFGFLAIASLLLSAAASAVAGYLSADHGSLALLVTVFDFVVSVSMLGVAFAALLRWLPARPPSRPALWQSALVSALLFAFGKSLIGLYLGRASVSSSYGAAGSFVVVLLWVYYSSQILLYGAAVGRITDELRADPQ